MLSKRSSTTRLATDSATPHSAHTRSRIVLAITLVSGMGCATVPIQSDACCDDDVAEIVDTLRLAQGVREGDAASIDAATRALSRTPSEFRPPELMSAIQESLRTPAHRQSALNALSKWSVKNFDTDLSLLLPNAPNETSPELLAAIQSSGGTLCAERLTHPTFQMTVSNVTFPGFLNSKHVDVALAIAPISTLEYLLGTSAPGIYSPPVTRSLVRAIEATGHDRHAVARLITTFRRFITPNLGVVGPGVTHQIDPGGIDTERRLIFNAIIKTLTQWDSPAFQALILETHRTTNLDTSSIFTNTPDLTNLKKWPAFAPDDWLTFRSQPQPTAPDATISELTYTPKSIYTPAPLRQPLAILTNQTNASPTALSDAFRDRDTQFHNDAVAIIRAIREQSGVTLRLRNTVANNSDPNKPPILPQDYHQYLILDNTSAADAILVEFEERRLSLVALAVARLAHASPRAIEWQVAVNNLDTTYRRLRATSTQRVVSKTSAILPSDWQAAACSVSTARTCKRSGATTILSRKLDLKQGLFREDIQMNCNGKPTVLVFTGEIPFLLRNALHSHYDIADALEVSLSDIATQQEASSHIDIPGELEIATTMPEYSMPLFIMSAQENLDVDWALDALYASTSIRRVGDIGVTPLGFKEEPALPALPGLAPVPENVPPGLRVSPVSLMSSGVLRDVNFDMLQNSLRRPLEHLLATREQARIARQLMPRVKGMPDQLLVPFSTTDCSDPRSGCRTYSGYSTQPNLNKQTVLGRLNAALAAAQVAEQELAIWDAGKLIAAPNVSFERLRTIVRSDWSAYITVYKATAGQAPPAIVVVTGAMSGVPTWFNYLTTKQWEFLKSPEIDLAGAFGDPSESLYRAAERAYLDIGTPARIRTVRRAFGLLGVTASASPRIGQNSDPRIRDLRLQLKALRGVSSASSALVAPAAVDLPRSPPRTDFVSQITAEWSRWQKAFSDKADEELRSIESQLNTSNWSIGLSVTLGGLAPSFAVVFNYDNIGLSGSYSSAIGISVSPVVLGVELASAWPARPAKINVGDLHIERREGPLYAYPPERSPAQSSEPSEDTALRWSEPIPGAAVTSNFGPRMHPVQKVPKMHSGVDFRAKVGTPVGAIAKGRVEWAGSCGPIAGICVIIRHSDGHASKYLHLSETAVKIGQQVQASEHLGKSGQTGAVEGPHLHLRIESKTGEPIDPLTIIRPR